jgi:hypothetical protein
LLVTARWPGAPAALQHPTGDAEAADSVGGSRSRGTGRAAEHPAVDPTPRVVDGDVATTRTWAAGSDLHRPPHRHRATLQGVQQDRGVHLVLGVGDAQLDADRPPARYRPECSALPAGIGSPSGRRSVGTRPQPLAAVPAGALCVQPGGLPETRPAVRPVRLPERGQPPVWVWHLTTRANLSTPHSSAASSCPRLSCGRIAEPSRRRRTGDQRPGRPPGARRRRAARPVLGPDARLVGGAWRFGAGIVGHVRP